VVVGAHVVFLWGWVGLGWWRPVLAATVVVICLSVNKRCTTIWCVQA
jgi:hypothetical protein